MNSLDQYDFVLTDFMDDNESKYSPLVGKYIIDFSYLEHALNILVAEIVHHGSHELGYIITTKMTMANKIDLLDRFIKLYKHHGLKRPSSIISLIPKLKDINSFRNSIAHANWAVMQASGRTRVKVKVDEDNGIWFKHKDLSIKTIRKKIKLLKQLRTSIENLEFDL